MNETEEMIFFL